ncbi:sugar ABC transporter permease [Bacillus mojavensis]|jgi:arabinogalactan oligomer/maltooligosaccharide transport system permease protein|uniref:Arabinogalactan oligomer ABC transporter permease GanQ n=1 Tax=Bacillus mojavensis TaxID=72360 RepID=A0AAP3CUE7_BACMO|nr:arabinogalactan oligomer ABC transporter permease GanQ [Bacillus mojavensis]MCY8106160.1 arabinogalactan oligomer ABC transporter permease GanQ [Bacillus mojavensis]MCY8483133.1 arabinogalactan oligomer ABC transporter permease GanQ [Bacillus mojavensis]MCY8511174.1 arabinogalactan oligomer ABC transporter permease GanQ [Bacillus mojavensis]MCY9090235.1 arabinogalactan oligomer ABC transporter permease GanQ [Bacillus mojavensis]MCY9189078.1 arabinogalactan oligomer ABC transporter permease 
MLADMKVRKFVRLLFSYLFLACMAVIIVYPLLWTAGASFNPGNSLISTSLIPKNPTFDHYKELFAGKESLQYVQWYINSIKISLFTMAGSLICVTFTAYAFSRFRFKGRKYALTLFLLLQMIPQFSALIALFVLAQILGMVNSHWLLILLYIGGLIPMNTYLMKGYMDSIPIDLDESAKMDGASSTRIFLQIILPLSKPMAAVVAMNGFTGPLGDFVLSSTILRTPESYTLPVGLFNLVNDVMGASYTTFAAGALLISIPVAVIFIMLQKNFVSGLTAGGTKG